MLDDRATRTTSLLQASTTIQSRKRQKSCLPEQHDQLAYDQSLPILYVPVVDFVEQDISTTHVVFASGSVCR